MLRPWSHATKFGPYFHRYYILHLGSMVIVCILPEIGAEIGAEWVPICPSTIDTMLRLIGPIFGVSVWVRTWEQAFRITNKNLISVFPNNFLQGNYQT